MSAALLKAVAVRTLSAIAAACIFLMMLLTFVDVFLRYLFARPISGSSEMVSFLLALLVFAALPIVTLGDGHISVSVLGGRLSPAWTWIVDLFCFAFSLASTLAMTYVLFVHGVDLGNNLQTTPVLGLPLAPLSFAMSASSALASAAVLVLIANHIRNPRAEQKPPLDEAPRGYEV